MATRRTQRVGESIKEVLGELIQRSVKDPRIGFVTITAVRLTQDLSRADVYYTVLGEESDRRDTEAGLDSAKPYLRTETGRRVRLKTVPDLEFHLDDAPEKGQRVDSIIDEIHRSETAYMGAMLPPASPEIETMLGRATELIDSAGSIAIACHVRPDGDALGCLLALALALQDRDVAVYPSWDADSVELPSQLQHLPGADLLVPHTSLRPTDVGIAVDCASIDRLGRLADRMKKSKALINLDHHVSNTKFGMVNIVDEHASSSAEIVVQLISRLGAEITPDIATCLYTGLVTDAGRFSYASVTPRTHGAAAFLLQRGVKVDEVSQALFESAPFNNLKVLGRVLDRATLQAEPGFVFSYVTQADLQEFGVTMDDTDDVIDTLRMTRECDVTALLKELADGSWKGSFRSKGATDVGSVASELGGGGHRLAAGFEIEGSLDDALATIREALGRGR